MGRTPTVALWVGAISVLWGSVAVAARVHTAHAAAVTNVLIILALPLTYVAVLGAAVQASAQPRRALGRVVALTLGVLMASGMLELAAAMRVAHWELVLMSLRGEQQHYLPDPDLGFRHAPNIRWSGRPRSDVEEAYGLPASRTDSITMTYDGRGYRNSTELSQAPVVLIGDSHVVGEYVSDDQVVSSLLRARLGQPVANLGVAGYGTAQELLVLKRDAVPLAPRIVIWFFFEGNDLYNDQEFENAMRAPSSERATSWTERHGWWRRSLIRSVYMQVRLMLYPIAPNYCPTFGTIKIGPHRGEKVLFGREAAYPWTDFEQERWEKAKNTLREAARFTSERDARLLVIYVPIKFRVYRDMVELSSEPELRRWALWPLPERFAEFCRDSGLTCMDLTQLLRDAAQTGRMPHAAADSHWSPEGHEIIAERLAAILTSLGWTAMLGRHAPIPSETGVRVGWPSSHGEEIRDADMTLVAKASRPWTAGRARRELSRVRVLQRASAPNDLAGRTVEPSRSSNAAAAGDDSLYGHRDFTGWQG